MSLSNVQEYITFIQKNSKNAVYQELVNIPDILLIASKKKDWVAISNLVSSLSHDLVYIWPLWTINASSKVTNDEKAERINLARQVLEIGYQAWQQLNKKQEAFSTLAYLMELMARSLNFEAILAYLENVDFEELDENVKDAWAYKLKIYSKLSTDLAKDLTSSEKLLLITIEIYQKLPQKETQLADSYWNLGKIYFLQEKTKLARQSYQKSIEYGHLGNYFDVIIQAYIGLIEISISNQDLNTAKILYDKAYRLVDETIDEPTQKDLERIKKLVFN